jgi:hypothetical protein
VQTSHIALAMGTIFAPGASFTRLSRCIMAHELLLRREGAEYMPASSFG